MERTTAAKPPFVYWTSLWAFGITIALVAIALDLLRPALNIPPGRDFANLYTAGKLALEGRADLAFDVNVFRLALSEIVGTLSPQNFSYPPHALFIAAPFALLPYGVSFVLWSALSMSFFFWAAKSFVRFSPLLTALTPAAVVNVWNGHYGLLLGGLWLLFFKLLQRRPMAAGLIASILTFKPHMGLFIGLSALSKWRAVAAAVMGTIALVGLSAWAFGPASWYRFIGQTVAVQVNILTRQEGLYYFQMMPSAFAAYGRSHTALLLQIMFAAAAIALLVRYRRVDPFAFATATFLIVPYVFVYDMTVACLGFAICIWNNWGSLSRGERAVLTIAFLIPVIAIGVSHEGTLIAPPILLAALYIQTKPRTGDYRAVESPDAPLQLLT